MVATYSHKLPLLTGLVLAALVRASTPAVAAEGSSADSTVRWRADALQSDLKHDLLELKGNVRLAQGPTSIVAEEAKADAFRSDSGRWTFQRGVQIRTAEAELKSNLARAELANGAITDAHVEGAPAEFQQRNSQPDRQVRGRAGVIDYDIPKGIVTLTGDVWFGSGKDEFRGDTVIYNIRDETVRVNPGGKSPGGVRGTLRPQDRPGKKPAAGSKDTTQPTAGRGANEDGGA